MYNFIPLEFNYLFGYHDFGLNITLIGMSQEFLKLLIIGDSGVGKSSILTRFCQNRFTQAFYNTIGVDFKTKTITVQNQKCKLQIWDTAGQQRFRTITANYYKGAHGILIVFDLTNKQSLGNVSFWLQEIEKHSSNRSSVILIGNKNDLQAKRQTSQDEALSFAKMNKLDYIECSAFNSLNIALVFEAIAKKVLRERQKRQVEETTGKSTGNLTGINLQDKQKKVGQCKKTSSCC